MNNEFIYDPEDLESLMMHKSFDELYPEERSFVLKHMKSQEEYESMRSTLFAIRASKSDNEELTMPLKTKVDVMDAFRAEHKREKWFTLNGLFIWLFPPHRSWAQKPAFQLAVVGAVVFGGVYFFNFSNSDTPSQLAELKPKQTTESKAKKEPSKAFDIKEEKVEPAHEAPQDQEVEMPEDLSSASTNQETELTQSDDLLPEVSLDEELVSSRDFKAEADAVVSKEKTERETAGTDRLVQEQLAEDSNFDTANSLEFEGTDSAPNADSFTFTSPATTSSKSILADENVVYVTAERSDKINKVSSSEDLSNVFTLLEAAY